MTAMATEKSYEQYVAEATEKLRTKTGKKLKAQEMLMHGIGNVLGYWMESHGIEAAAMSEKEREEFGKILLREADRVAKLFGFDEAWSN